MTETDLHEFVAEQILAMTDERTSAAARGWTQLFRQLPASWLIFRVGPHSEIGYTTNESWAETPWWVIFDNRIDLTVDVYTESLWECVDEVLKRFGGDPGNGPHDPPILPTVTSSTQLTREQIAAKAMEKRKRKKGRGSSNR